MYSLALVTVPVGIKQKNDCTATFAQIAFNWLDCTDVRIKSETITFPCSYCPSNCLLLTKCSAHNEAVDKVQLAVNIPVMAGQGGRGSELHTRQSECTAQDISPGRQGGASPSCAGKSHQSCVGIDPHLPSSPHGGSDNCRWQRWQCNQQHCCKSALLGTRSHCTLPPECCIWWDAEGRIPILDLPSTAMPPLPPLPPSASLLFPNTTMPSLHPGSMRMLSEDGLHSWMTPSGLQTYHAHHLQHT